MLVDRSPNLMWLSWGLHENIRCILNRIAGIVVIVEKEPHGCCVRRVGAASGTAAERVHDRQLRAYQCLSQSRQVLHTNLPNVLRFTVADVALGEV